MSKPSVLVVTGTRYASKAEHYEIITEVLESILGRAAHWIVYHGNCPPRRAPNGDWVEGTDQIAHDYLQGLPGVEVRPRPALWDSINPVTARPYGRKAGPIRNQQMVDEAAYLVESGQANVAVCQAFVTNPKCKTPCRGTIDCFERARRNPVIRAMREKWLWIPKPHRPINPRRTLV